MGHRHGRYTVGVCAIPLLVGACSSPDPDGGFASDAPGADIAAIAETDRKRDASHIRDLIECLDSDDPVVRWTAINALKDITGQTHGFDFAASWGQRQAAILRWKQQYPEVNRPAPRAGTGQAGSPPDAAGWKGGASR